MAAHRRAARSAGALRRQGADGSPARPLRDRPWRRAAPPRSPNCARPAPAEERKIVATAEILANVGDLYEAGADYVTVTRLSDAHELYKVIEAAQAGLLDDKRAETDALLSERREVLP